MVILSLTICAVAQTPHKGVFRIYEPGYYQNTILKGVENYESRKEAAKPKPTFRLDPAGLQIPADKSLYTTAWHIEPVSQGNTNTCWSFSAISMLESEIYRLKQIGRAHV